MNKRGVIPVFFLVIVAAAIAFIAGVKAEQRVIDRTQICHDPNAADYFPSMSVPNYNRSGR